MEERFCLFVAQGRLPTQAYRMSWGACRNADTLAAKAMARPAIRARIAQLQEQIAAQALSLAIMSQRERRELLAETARSVRKADKATHGERIRALELDARLAGDLDNTVQVTGDLDIRACILAMVGSAQGVPVSAPVAQAAQSPSGPGVEAGPVPTPLESPRMALPVASPVAPVGLVSPPVPDLGPSPAVSFVDEV